MAEVMTWEDYKKWVSELVRKKNRFYCRGQSNENWKLKTSFHREAEHNKITLAQYLEFILPEVQYHLSAVCDEIIDMTNPMEFGAVLALIQHHGFPTPLLDWTYSPFIAAYFAFREVNDQLPVSENVKIYVFDYLEWSKAFKQILDLRDATKFVSVIRPYAKLNPRIIPQQGVCTMTNVDDIETYIKSRETEAKKTFLYSGLLSVKEKPYILRELNLMGINEMTLFPSVGGICRALKSQFFLPDSVGATFKELLQLQLNKPVNTIPAK